MNIVCKSDVYEVELLYNKRCISYFDTGYSYWYNGKEVCNGTYSSDRWNKILDKYNGGNKISLKRNLEYSYEQSLNFDKLIKEAVRKELKK